MLMLLEVNNSIKLYIYIDITSFFVNFYKLEKMMLSEEVLLGCIKE